MERGAVPPRAGFANPVLGAIPAGPSALRPAAERLEPSANAGRRARRETETKIAAAGARVECPQFSRSNRTAIAGRPPPPRHARGMFFERFIARCQSHAGMKRYVVQAKAGTQSSPPPAVNQQAPASTGCPLGDGHDRSVWQCACQPPSARMNRTGAKPLHFATACSIWAGTERATGETDEPDRDACLRPRPVIRSGLSPCSNPSSRSTPSPWQRLTATRFSKTSISSSAPTAPASSAATASASRPSSA